MASTYFLIESTTTRREKSTPHLISEILTIFFSFHFFSHLFFSLLFISFSFLFISFRFFFISLHFFSYFFPFPSFSFLFHTRYINSSSHKQTNKQTNKRTNERTNERTIERTNKHTNKTNIVGNKSSFCVASNISLLADEAGPFLRVVLHLFVRCFTKRKTFSS